jgi:ubiquinone/menaquinone biosynthesis C-methylase UbiE
MTRSPYQDPAVAAAFGCIAEPAQFARPARDLVAMLGIPAGCRVLDVGTGTGALARPAAAAVGRSGFVVGLDPSFAMLSAADRRDPCRSVNGQAPGLPFADCTFHVVCAGFVLHHCRSYSTALADMRRVCRPGGRVGITEWGTMPNLPAQIWKDLVASYVDLQRLHSAFTDLVPWEEWFGWPSNVERALREAGLTAIEVTTREYTVVVTPGNDLRMKEGGVEGTLIRQLIGERSWNDFTNEAKDVFQDKFKDAVTFVRDVHFGVATKHG